MQLLDELFPLLSDEPNVAGREQEIFTVCAEELVVCLDGQIGVGQDLLTLLAYSSALVSRASSLDIQWREGSGRRREASRRCVHTRRAR